jgi:hypothetical protein
VEPLSRHGAGLGGKLDELLMDWDLFVQNRYGNQVKVRGVIVQGPHGVWVELPGSSASLCGSCEESYMQRFMPPPPCGGCGE